jgi:hypothetical protein
MLLCFLSHDCCLVKTKKILHTDQARAARVRQSLSIAHQDNLIVSENEFQFSVTQLVSPKPFRDLLDKYKNALASSFEIGEVNT